MRWLREIVSIEIRIFDLFLQNIFILKSCLRFLIEYEENMHRIPKIFALSPWGNDTKASTDSHSCLEIFKGIFDRTNEKNIMKLIKYSLPMYFNDYLPSQKDIKDERTNIFDSKSDIRYVVGINFSCLSYL